MEQIIMSPAPSLLISEQTESMLYKIAESAMARAPEVAMRLQQELDRADVVPESEMPADVVTFGSFVTYELVLTGAIDTIQLVRPHEVDLSRKRVSIISGMGAGLIGLRAGQQIEWELGGRQQVIKVVGVSNVPESDVPAS